MRSCLCLTILTAWICQPALGADTFPQFKEQVIDANIGKVCYADTIADVDLVDQCGESLPLWDLTGKYYILFLTAAW